MTDFASKTLKQSHTLINKPRASRQVEISTILQQYKKHTLCNIPKKGEYIDKKATSAISLLSERKGERNNTIPMDIRVDDLRSDTTNPLSQIESTSSSSDISHSIIQCVHVDFNPKVEGDNVVKGYGRHTIHHKISQNSLKNLNSLIELGDSSKDEEIKHLVAIFKQKVAEATYVGLEGKDIFTMLNNIPANLEVGPNCEDLLNDAGSAFDGNTEEVIPDSTVPPDTTTSTSRRRRYSFRSEHLFVMDDLIRDAVSRTTPGFNNKDWELMISELSKVIIKHREIVLKERSMNNMVLTNPIGEQWEMVVEGVIRRKRSPDMEKKINETNPDYRVLERTKKNLERQKKEEEKKAKEEKEKIMGKVRVCAGKRHDIIKKIKNKCNDGRITKHILSIYVELWKEYRKIKKEHSLTDDNWGIESPPIKENGELIEQKKKGNGKPPKNKPNTTEADQLMEELKTRIESLKEIFLPFPDEDRNWVDWDSWAD